MAEVGEGTIQDSKQTVKAKQPSQAYGRSSISSASSSSSLPNKSLSVPIAALVPGQTVFDWEIRGHVVHKSDIRPYTNGHGVYFSFEMRDEAGGEIRVVCFEGEVSRFFEKMVEGKEHVLSRGKLMKPKERFNRMNRRCEIVLGYDSEIRLLEDDEEVKSNDNNNNKSLLERLREIQKVLEFCTSKLQELETEIKKTGRCIVKMEEVAGGVVGVFENRLQGKKKIESPVIRKTSSNTTTTTRGAALGTAAVTRVSPSKFLPNKVEVPIVNHT